mgnify:CR=1
MTVVWSSVVTVRYGMVQYGTVQYGMAWYNGTLCNGMVTWLWYDMMWCA